MRHPLTLGPKTAAVIMAFLFTGFSLLFSGCSSVDDLFACDCYPPFGPPPDGFVWQVQIYDCDSPPTVFVVVMHKADFFGLDPTVIKNCSRILRHTKAVAPQ